MDFAAAENRACSHQQVPPLRIAIGGTNRNATFGMTGFSRAIIKCQENTALTVPFWNCDRCVLLPNPRVRHRVQDVRQEIHGDVRQADRQNAALDQIVIAIRDGLDGQAADAGPGEDGFGNDGAG